MCIEKIIYTMIEFKLYKNIFNLLKGSGISKISAVRSTTFT